MTTFTFAQLSDIHINHVQGDHHDVLGGQSAGWLKDVITELSRQTHLDMVLISGDLVDNALPSEFSQFGQIINRLTRPCHIIPGNHDRRDLNSVTGLSRYEFAQHFNPQIADRPNDGQAQAGYWSLAVHPQIQVIGLDSIRDADWSGVIDAPQMAWLEEELTHHNDKFVIVMVHHPLRKLAPIDSQAGWTNFVCNNGAEVLALLDRHPQVKLVLTGHHHCTKADLVGARLHLASPAIAIYPCAYRTIRLTHQPDNCWQVSWQTHPAATKAMVEHSRQMMFAAWEQARFDSGMIAEHADIAWGNDFDRDGEIVFN